MPMTENAPDQATSRVRVQPVPVEVPTEGDPFQYDLLGRKAFGEALAASIAAVEGPGVFALDGQWGTGKTTFVQMFTQHLRNEGFRVVEINAWETDYADNPLAAISSSLMAAFPDDESKRGLRTALVKLLRVVGPPAIRIATFGSLDLDPTIEKEAGEMLAKWAESNLTRLEEHPSSLEEFRVKLRGLAAPDGDKPMVVVVDELDRCRPTYAVELLETIKHVFDEDGLVFVLALNRRQLDRSAAVLYGSTVDPESYFRKFFDVELRLPDPPDGKVVARTILKEYDLPPDDVPGILLVDFLSAGPYGIRLVKHVLQRYAIIRGSLVRYYHSDSWWWMLPTFMLLRLIDEDAYRAFLAGTMSDEALVGQVFQLDWTIPLRGSSAGNILEAATITAHKARSRDSSLVVKYLSEMAADPDAHGSDVLEWSNKMSSHGHKLNQMVSTVAERIEVFELRQAVASH